jgi:dephospho-CoA kinase
VRIIGLTGGIASGKTTVQHMLADLGATVIDADQIYHDLIAPTAGEASALARQIESQFPGSLGPEGHLDRRALAARVFADTGLRRTLEAIAHPAVRVEFLRRAKAAADQGARLVIYDVPLLFERQLEGSLAGVVVVWVARDVQLQRLLARNGIDVAEANKRLSAQLSLDEKRRRATWVIDNSGTLAQTRAQVELIWPALTA